MNEEDRSLAIISRSRSGVKSERRREMQASRLAFVEFTENISSLGHADHHTGEHRSENSNMMTINTMTRIVD
jgi:hypothetical protein